MDADKREALAGEFRVLPATIDRLQILGLDDDEVTQLLHQQYAAGIVFETDPDRYQTIKPPVRNIANAYLLFKRNIARVETVVEHSLADAQAKGYCPEDNPLNCKYPTAQAFVTDGFQRALYMEILTAHDESQYLDTEPTTIDPILVEIMLRRVMGNPLVSAESTLRALVSQTDRAAAEELVNTATQAALKLPDQDIYLRTPNNDQVVISKPDILLGFASYKADDTEFLEATKAAIINNNDATRLATRTLELYAHTQNDQYLAEAGITAFRQAGELLERPPTITEEESPGAGYYVARLFDVLHAVAEIRGHTPVGREFDVFRGLLERTQQLNISGRWVAEASYKLAVLANATAWYKTFDESGYLVNFVLHGEEPLEPILATRMAALDAARGSRQIMNASLALIEVVELFNDPAAVERLLNTNYLEHLYIGEKTRIRNALCDALIKQGNFQAAETVATSMTNKRNQRRFLLMIDLLRSQGEVTE